MTVARILDKKGKAVITTEGSSSLHEAARIMAEHRIGALVVNGVDHSVAGILSERDIVRAVAQGGAAALQSPVSAHMTRKVITCVAATPVNEVMGIMSAGKFRHVPVLRDNRLDGMISIGDVVKHRLAELEYESQTLRDYITAS
jgi:CBS domain-containing protein